MKKFVFGLAVLGAMAAAEAAFGALQGRGVEGDPYLIGSYADLKEFAQVVNGGHATIPQNNAAWAVVTNDITTTESNWTAIGADNYYQGTFDGAGHAISGLAYEGNSHAGLFGVVGSGGVVRNVRLAEVSFHGKAAGGIAEANQGTVSNCCVSGSVGGGDKYYAGGVVGANEGTVANCYNTATASVGDMSYVGGIVGYNFGGGMVTNCHSTGRVLSGDFKGGVVGYNDGTVANSYCLDDVGVAAVGGNAGTVEGCAKLSATDYTNEASFSGWDFDHVWVMWKAGPVLRMEGLLGSGTAEDPYGMYDYGTLVAFAEAVNGGQDDAWGVLAADIAATEADWVAIGQDDGYNGTFDGAGHVISGLANAGTPKFAGLFGQVYRGGVVRNVRLAGVAFNGVWAGGVVGENSGSVSNCCVSGSVWGEFYAGGVTGFNYGTVANCYNTGAVSGGSDVDVGGIVGFNGSGGMVMNCHSTGAVPDGGVVGTNEGTVKNSYCPVSLGVPAILGGSGRVSGECEALPAREYTSTASFRNWDFDRVWAMGTEGPYLRVLGERVEYPVWVDGVQVTDANSGDILGNGTARFAGTMSWGTLMLTNAVITNAVEYQSGSAATAGIYAGNGFDLTISLEGSNRVENATEYGVGNGILAEGNLSLGGTGSLTAEAGSSANGIYANGNLRIEDATVAASGLYGLCSGKNIVFTNATVTATGAFDAISANGSATFAGESRVEATATGSGQDGVFAEGGITVGEELNLIEPVGGSVSGGGVVDAAGKTAAHVLVAYFYELTIDNGSTTNQITAAGFDIVIIADEPQDGEAFVQWSSNVEGLEFDDRDAPETRFTMPATNVTVTARYAIVPEVAVSCAVGGVGGTNDEMTVTVAGPADCDGVADVAVYADETGAGEPVWATNGVALAAGRAEFTVSPAGGVVPAGGQHVFATYLPNDRYAGATASNRVMGTSAMAIGADDAYDGDDVTVVATLGHDDCTGTVTVDVGGNAYIEAVEDGAATLVIQGLAAGDYDATATYSGDDSYLAVSTNFSFTVFPRRGQEEVDGVVWYYAAHGDGTAMVTGVASNHATGNLTMPETLGGWTVTEVGVDAFMQCTNITGMAIAGGVTNIMGIAFASCTGLTDMTIPDLVTDIGRYAFNSCEGLTNVTVGAGVTNIEDSAFNGCYNLATVSLPEGLVSIGAWAFAHSALADVRIPDSVADIGEKAFYISGSLTNVRLGTGIESVGENAFAYCDALAAVWAPVEQEGTGLLDAAGLPAGCEIHYYGTQTVTFDPNGGTCATATNAYAIGEAYGALPEAGRDGHDFAGWWDDAAGVEVTTNSIVTEKAARTLVAHWKEGAVTYVVRGWDGSAVTESDAVCTNYTVYNGQTRLESGWYVVAGNVTNDNRIEVSGEVHLILVDGATLTVPKGITFSWAYNSLAVYGQTNGTGRLFSGTDGTTNEWGQYIATCGSFTAGIGGGPGESGGAVTVYGGTVAAAGGQWGAGIGGGKGDMGSTVAVYGGAVAAQGGDGGAGIGGGETGTGGKLAVYGGTVTATGGQGGAGIGGGYLGAGGDVAIHGGTVTATGVDRAAAIGKGDGGRSDGGLEIAGMKVGHADGDGRVVSWAAPDQRDACCRNREGKSVRLEACDPHDTAGAVCSRCGRKSFLVRKLYDNRHWDKTRYSTVELAVYSEAAKNPDAQGCCLTYVTEGEAIDLTDNLDGNGEHAKLNGVHDIEQANHFMVPFNERGWAYLKADLQENGAIRVTGEFGPYNPSYEAEAPNGKDRRMTLSTDGLFEGQAFYVIERSPGDYDPTGYVYVGDDAEADPRVDSSAMTTTWKLDQAVMDGTDPVPENEPNHVPATVEAGALYLTGTTTGEGTTVFVVNSFDMNKASPDYFHFLEVTASVPWDGRVSFFFDPGDPASQRPVWNPPFLSIVATDTATGSNYVSTASALSAESPERLDAALHARTDDDTLDAPYTVTWDMSALVPDDFSTTGMVFTVDYLALPEYCVIDLTGGTNGASPAVSYLDAPPEGGWTDLYKTERLPMRLVPPETEGARPFYCALFETTQKQWELVTGGTPSAFPGATRPVERVSWNDIRGDAETCDWPAADAVGEDSFVGILRRRTGLSALDLPTEAQWEFACRGWRTTDYGYGHVPNGDGMWFKDNSGGETHEAGTRTTNFFGLHDMHGNVAEWCLDRASSTGPERVLRGGGWDDYAPACTSSSRSGRDPATGDGHCGFRLVRHLPLDSESERRPEAEPGGLRVGTVPTQDEEDPTIVSYSCASEAIALSRDALRPVPYVVREWDGSAVTESNAVCTNYTVYNGQTTLTSGWWVVLGSVTNDNRIEVSGDVRVILCDRMTLTVLEGITVEGRNNSLTVYGQSGDSGRLFAGTDGTTDADGNYIATCPDTCAGIGGATDNDVGTLTIDGGTVAAAGGNLSAGIGGGYMGGGGVVTIYGGSVSATGGDEAAGIGGGYMGGGGGVAIYGGTVAATGSRYAAGIGGGYDGGCNYTGGTVAIHGGTVTATGGDEAAGIGGGLNGAGSDVAIHGGKVTVTGDGGSAAIGKGAFTSDSASDGGLEIVGMRVTDPAGTLATNRVEACRALGQSVTLEECWPHEYEGEKCKWCGAANPVAKVEVQTGAGSTNAVITFTLARDIAGDAPEGAAPHLVVTAVDTATGERAVADASALAADYAARAGTAGEHTVTWNLADAFGEGFASTGVVFTVEYRYDAPARWCVLDLSGGKDAADYPVSHLAEEPAGGFNTDAWKTTNLVLRLVEPGTFTMGSPTNELGQRGDTQHEVTLTRPFYIGVFETTQRQWELVTGGRPSYFVNAACYATRPVEQVSYVDIRGSSVGIYWPVTNSVDDSSFLGFLRARTGLVFDLPTEAQWEYACRAGTTNALNSGKDLASEGEDDNMGEVGRYRYNGGLDGDQQPNCLTNAGTAAVGSYDPNDWGLYDMHGNVWEWCLDWYGNYPDGAATDPVGSDSGSGRVLRGGCWYSSAKNCRSAFRESRPPAFPGDKFGFRLALPVAGEVPLAERTAAGRASEAVEVQMLKAFAEGDIVVTGCTNVYDGTAHGIAVATNAIEGLELRYGIGPSALDFGLSEPPGFTDVTNATVWVKASAPGYFTATNRATVAITPAELTIAAKDQEYVWNGQPQGEGGTTYTATNEIAAKVEATGLKGNDRIGSVKLDGQATEVNVYSNRIVASEAQIFNGTNNVTGNYAIGYAAGTLTIVEAWQTVTFNANGGTCGTATNRYKCMEPYGELPVATRALHTFDGWKTADGARVAATNIVSLDAELTLVADWLAGTTTNGVRWLCATNGDGTVTVTGAVPTAGDMAMPDTLDGFPVTAVGTNAFENCTNLTGMAVADGVTNIGEWAFSECYGLTNVTFGTNVTAIGDHAFYGCVNLTEVAIPGGVTALEAGVFMVCEGLTNVTMGGAVTNIGEGAFYMCEALREVELPEGLASIGSMAFAGSGLADVRVPDATTNIASQAFAFSPAFTNVWLGTGIESVGETAFAGCTNLVAIWVPVEKKEAGLLDGAMLPAGCEIRYYGTQTVTFDANGGTCSVATNGYVIGAPYGALPEATWKLHTFEGWRGTNGAPVAATNPVTEEAARTLVAAWTNGVVVGNVLWLCQTNADGTVTVTGAEPAEGDLVMPDELDGYAVTAVGEDAFRWCTNLTGMTIAAGVTNLAADAFLNCTALGEMAIPDGVTDIGAYAFCGCDGLTNLTIGAGVTNIAENAFDWCTSLESVALPEGLASLGAWAFGYAPLAEVRIPDATVNIGSNAFYGNGSLATVWLGTGIESVGADAFAGCTNLATVWAPVEQAGTGLLDGTGLPAGCEVHWYGTQVVTFDANGGACATATNAYAIGEAYGALPEARREGHDFAGWWDDAAGVEVTARSTVTEAAARTLTAHWRQSKRTLTVQAGRWGRAVAVVGGTTNVVAGGKTTTFSVTYGTTVSVKAVPDAGFAVDGAGAAAFPSFQEDARVAFAFLPNPTATLKWKYARNANGWFCAQIAVPWHAGYGEALGNLRFLFADRTDAAGKATAYLVDTGTVFGALGRVETHEGRKYRAAGIDTKGFAALSGGKRAVFGVGDATLKSSLASVPKEERKIALRVVNRNLDTVKPLDDKVGFLAWETGGTTRYLAISPDGTAAARGVRRSLRDFADWEEEPVPEVIAAARSYTVAFDANGGTGRMAKQSMTSGKAAKLRKNAFKRNGWVFTGWAKSKTGKVVYKDQAKVKNLGAAGKAVTLYAKWAKKSYTVAFDANGGKGKMAKQSMTYGKSAKLRKNAFRRSGWVFTGWAKSKTGKVVYKDRASVKNLRADGKTTTLYAKWAKKSYTVAFDANGGKGKMAKQSMTYGKAAKLRKNAFTSDGRTFLGWATSKDGPVLYADQAKVKNLRADGKTKTLYAKWRRTFQIDYAATGDASSQAAGATSPRAVKSEKRKVKRGNGVVVTTSDGSDGAAVADGDEGTSWSPEGTGWIWVVLAFPAPLDVADVEVVGDHLPEGTRILLSEDAAEWRETAAGRAQYVWVAFPDGEEAPAVREIRVAEAAADGREER